MARCARGDMVCVSTFVSFRPGQDDVFCIVDNDVVCGNYGAGEPTEHMASYSRDYGVSDGLGGDDICPDKHY